MIAPSGKSIPEGEHNSILDKKASAGGVPPATTPPFAGAILSRGSEGEQVKTLELRLQGLGIYNGPIDGDFGTKTDVAVRDLQSDEFGSAEADGRVGPKTWASLWSQSPVVQPSAPVLGEAGKTYLRLTKTSKRDRHGLTVLVLEYIKNGAVVGSLNVNSGAPGRQSFRIGTASVPGSLEPLPEGQWKIHTIAWADGRDNYNGQVFSSGLGPFSTPLTYVGPGSTSRSAIEIHIDFNQNSGALGTAGCVGIQSIGDYKILVGWLRDTNPENLYVDWGLGTTPKH